MLNYIWYNNRASNKYTRGVKMNFDYSKFKGKIRELGMTQNEFAKKIGISEQTLNLRFKNLRPFTQTEIFKTMKIFNS